MVSYKDRDLRLRCNVHINKDKKIITNFLKMCDNQFYWQTSKKKLWMQRVKSITFLKIQTL